MVKNASYYGYKVGDKFKYKDGVVNSQVLMFNDYEILTLIDDDGSEAPYFECRNKDRRSYENLELLKYFQEEDDPTITFEPYTVTINWKGISFTNSEVSTDEILECIKTLSKCVVNN